MSTRIDYTKAAPEAYQAMLGLEKYLHHCGLDESLLELVKMRVSQINGCAFCCDMHSKELRATGESEQKLYVLSAWREAPFYSERERAALAWAEALTSISKGEVSDAIYQQARKHFNEKELVNLTLAITTINSWNRWAISFETPVGWYKAGMLADWLADPGKPR